MSVVRRHFLDGLQVGVDGLRQLRAVILVDLIEVTDHRVLDLLVLYLAKIHGQVFDQIILFVLAESAIEVARLLEIARFVDRLLLCRTCGRILAVAEGGLLGGLAGS